MQSQQQEEEMRLTRLRMTTQVPTSQQTVDYEEQNLELDEVKQRLSNIFVFYS